MYDWYLKNNTSKPMRQEEIEIALAFLSFCISVVVYYYM